MVNRERIARKVAWDIKDGEFVNFGHGIPYSVAAFIDPRKKIFIHNEPGVICTGPGSPPQKYDYDMLDSANDFVSDLPGGAFMDTADSFAMIRGGHIGKTVLGALQVDENADIANWAATGRPPAGIGGAMDLCAGCPEVLIAMESMTKNGMPKLLRKCTYPLTAAGKATKVYTEFGVMTVKPGEGFRLIEKFPDYSVDDIRKMVAVDFKTAEDLTEIDLGIPL
ncbi:MAG: succinyl-CoA--3-ketoacid-CoA transferase [Clostridiales Family XIII bacterium]|jgi:3-oxoacid CoA-transferase B subunit|nr:succinyl-CoA--3-ketoacid-CoA transferase [Clostridiales Family XIII bacterium]